MNEELAAKFTEILADYAAHLKKPVGAVPVVFLQRCIDVRAPEIAELERQIEEIGKEAW
jgi:hypothetical protein